MISCVYTGKTCYSVKPLVYREWLDRDSYASLVGKHKHYMLLNPNVLVALCSIVYRVGHLYDAPLDRWPVSA
jgi:hypothetical protein